MRTADQYPAPRPPRPPRPPGRRRGRQVGRCLALVVVALLGSGLRPLTLPSTLAVVAVALSALVLVLVRVRVRVRGSSPAAGTSAAGARAPLPRGGLCAWAGVAAAGVAWELLALVGSPREEHPTLSSLLEPLAGSRPGLLAGWLAWLALGVLVVRR